MPNATYDNSKDKNEANPQDFLCLSFYIYQALLSNNMSP